LRDDDKDEQIGEITGAEKGVKKSPEGGDSSREVTVVRSARSVLTLGGEFRGTEGKTGIKKRGGEGTLKWGFHRWGSNGEGEYLAPIRGNRNLKLRMAGG